jgi:hypothetical protein
VLEAMLADSDGLVRQAAAFGLGELGGAASVRRLEEQLALEEARGDYDGEAVAEDITQALGRIEGAGARASLVRRLERMAAGKPELSDVNALACALWRRRHAELIPTVRQSLKRLSLPEPHGLSGLLVLLEKSPEELSEWARDPTVPLGFKARALAVLEEEVPPAWQLALAGFIAIAQALSGEAVSQDREARSYCERLFSLLLGDRDRFLNALSEEARSVLRAVALKLIKSTYPNSSVRAAVMLKAVGLTEDAAALEAYCPADPTCAQVFNDAARALRSLQKN